MANARSEIEAKFNLPNIEGVRRELQAAGARLASSRTFERNLRFDTPDRSLHTAHQVLRLRQGTRALLTYKQSHSPEQRTEIEFEVDDPDAARAFLEALGYEVVFIYEKYRQIFEYQESLVALDELPFGHFVEVEGPTLDAVRRAAMELGLSWDARVPPGYMEIFARMRRRRSLPFRDATFENCEGLERVSRDEMLRNESSRGREGSR
jgi:adenylate cyclase class 2